MSSLFLLKTGLHLVFFTPLLVVYYQAFSDQLGADPVKEIIHFTGIGALNVLLLTLMVSPLARQFKFAALMQSRRLIGLYAFVYACAHLVNFFVFDLQLNFPLLIMEIIERPYITLGMVAFVLIAALAITSPMAVRRKMGRKWQQLHNSIYLLAVLVVIHFYWSVKSAVEEPLVYSLVLLVLLYFRRQKFARWR